MSAPVDVLAVPATFYDDHAERDLPTPVEVRRAGSRVYIRADDPAIESLRRDAAFYADPRCMDASYCPRSIIESAKRTLSALARIGGAQ